MNNITYTIICTHKSKPVFCESKVTLNNIDFSQIDDKNFIKLYVKQFTIKNPKKDNPLVKHTIKKINELNINVDNIIELEFIQE